MKNPFSADARALLLACACVAGMESLLAFALPKTIDPRTVYPFIYFNVPPSLESSILQWQMDILLSRQIPEVDVLFLGDSSCLMGVIPRILEKKTGLKVWNLGTIAWLATEGHADVLQLYLKSHAKPRLIIYYISIYPLTATSAEINGLGYLDTFQTWLGLRPSFFVSRIPSYRLRQLLQWTLPRRFLRKDFLDHPRGPFPSDIEVHRLLLESHGSLIETRKEDMSKYSSPRLHFSPDCVPGLQHLFALSDTYHVPLYIVLNPLPVCSKTPQLNVDLAQIHQELRKVIEGKRKVHIRIPFGRYFPNEDLATLYHLSERGAQRNTEELSQWISRLVRTSTTAMKN
jgi:hypothetical protein